MGTFQAASFHVSVFSFNTQKPSGITIDSSLWLGEAVNLDLGILLSSRRYTQGSSALIRAETSTDRFWLVQNWILLLFSF